MTIAIPTGLVAALAAIASYVVAVASAWATSGEKGTTWVGVPSVLMIWITAALFSLCFLLVDGVVTLRRNPDEQEVGEES